MGKIKTVSLREQDKAIIEYLDTLDNFSEWVRQKALSDMELQKKGIDPVIARYIEKIVDTKLAGRLITSEQPIEENSDDVKGDVEKMF